MRKITIGLSLYLVFAASAADSTPLKWPQFRGPGGSGVGDDKAALPSEFGPNKNVLWKTTPPRGHGSPCIWGDRIFVTSYDTGKKLLEVIAIDRKTGRSCGARVSKRRRSRRFTTSTIPPRPRRSRTGNASTCTSDPSD